MMIRIACSLVALSIFSLAVTQDNKLEFDEIEMLSTYINTTSEEVMPIISDDGRRLYFVRAAYDKNVGGRLAGQDIWYSEHKGSLGWSKARRFEEFNNRGNNAIVGIEDTGKRVYLLNSYEDNLGSKSGLSYSEIKEGEWSPPVVTKIEGICNRGLINELYGLTVNQTADVLLISMKEENSIGEEDLYVSFKYTGWNRFHQVKTESKEDGFYWWSPPIHLGDVINSKGFEISPFLSPDGKTLFFSSNREGGLGKADIYYSTRLDDTWQNWSEPVNLGEDINSTKFDAYFHIAADSSVYFSSSRRGRLSDIYTTRLLKNDHNILKVAPELLKEVPFIKEGPKVIYEIETQRAEEVEKPKTEIEKPRKLSQLQLDSLNRATRNIMFDHDSDNLLLQDLDVLLATISILQSTRNLELHLVGHTDHVGSNDANELLAKKRAQSVKRYLLEQGISSDIVFIDGAGEEDPVASNEHREGRELNRRVELFFKLISE